MKIIKCWLIGINFLFVILLTAPNTKAETPKVGAEVQIQYNNFSGDSYKYPVSSFDLRIIRPYWKGVLINGKLKYKLVLTYDKNSSDLGVLDAYGDYQITNTLNVRFGQFKAPFDRQFLTPTTAMQFIERGIGGLRVLDRDRGMILYGNFYKSLLTYSIGMFNGNGIEKKFNAKNKSGKDDQRHIYAVRFIINPQGEYDYKLALPGQADQLKTTIGFGFTSGQKNDSTDVVAYCFDFAGRFQGITSMIEYQNKETKDPQKGTITGITVQAGYFILSKLEPTLRYSNQKIKNSDAKTELTSGINYYFVENNAKIQLNYIWFENKAAAGIKSHDNKIQLLYQMIF